MRQEMKKSRAVVTLLVTIAITAILLFTSVAGWGADGAGSAKDIKLGLDRQAVSALPIRLLVTKSRLQKIWQIRCINFRSV